MSRWFDRAHYHDPDELLDQIGEPGWSDVWKALVASGAGLVLYLAALWWAGAGR